MQKNILKSLCAMALLFEMSLTPLWASTTESGNSGGSQTLEEESSATHEGLREKRRKKHKKKKLQEPDTGSHTEKGSGTEKK